MKYRKLTLFAALVCALAPTAAEAQSIRYYHQDAQGSLRLMTDETGQVVWNAEPSPYGALTTHSSERPQRFVDRPQDSSGLFQLGLRYYDPDLGAFISTDPVSILEHGFTRPEALNRLAYGATNPLRYEDQNGQWPFETIPDIIDTAYSAWDYANDPSDINLLFLLWSVGAVFTPYVPGAYVGRIARSLGWGDNLFRRFDDLILFIGKADEAVPLVTKSGSTGTRIAKDALGESIQSLKKQLGSGKGPWQRGTAHVENSASASKRLRGGTSTEEVFVNQETGKRLIRHTVVKDGNIVHETFRDVAKFGTE